MIIYRSIQDRAIDQALAPDQACSANGRRELGEARLCWIVRDSCGGGGRHPQAPPYPLSTCLRRLATINAWTRLSSKPLASHSRVLKRAKRTLTEKRDARFIYGEHSPELVLKGRRSKVVFLESLRSCRRRPQAPPNASKLTWTCRMFAYRQR